MHPEAALGSPSPSRSGVQSILIVEDDPAMAEVLETSLAARGMTIRDIDAQAFRPGAERLWAAEGLALGVDGWLGAIRA